MQFRLLHHWEAHKNVKGGPGILLGIEMLMIDEEVYQRCFEKKNTYFICFSGEECCDRDWIKKLNFEKTLALFVCTIL